MSFVGAVMFFASKCSASTGGGGCRMRVCEHDLSARLSNLDIVFCGAMDLTSSNAVSPFHTSGYVELIASSQLLVLLDELSICASAPLFWYDAMASPDWQRWPRRGLWVRAGAGLAHHRV